MDTVDSHKELTFSVANYLCALAERDGVQPDVLKIQKLLYFAHGWKLALHDKPLVTEQFLATRFGVRVNSLYNHALQHGRNVRRYAVGEALVRGKHWWNIARLVDVYPPSIEELHGQSTLDIIDRVVEVNGWDGSELCARVLAEGSPTQLWYQRYPYHVTVGIPNDDIRAYFLALAKRKETNDTTSPTR